MVIKNLGGFSITPIQSNGIIFNSEKYAYPSNVETFVSGKNVQVQSACADHVFGFVYKGEIEILKDNNNWIVREGHSFSIPGKFLISGDAKVVMFRRIGYNGFFQIGGPLEEQGRVAYIDGCSDSLLFFPLRLGDPCMNCLWFPKNVRQTMHIHPTIRYALVVKGNGRCITPEGELPLLEGNIFTLKPMSFHCFYTDDSEMSIVTYHPDSDWGPTDDSHPMKNMTIFESKK